MIDDEPIENGHVGALKTWKDVGVSPHSHVKPGRQKRPPAS